MDVTGRRGRQSLDITSHFFMRFLMFLFREDYYKALINLRIERDVYFHQWTSIWWDREMERQIIQITTTKKGFSR